MPYSDQSLVPGCMMTCGGQREHYPGGKLQRVDVIAGYRTSLLLLYLRADLRKDNMKETSCGCEEYQLLGSAAVGLYATFS